MQSIFTFENLGTLFMLILLQIVLGFDNLLYISIESKRAPLGRQNQVRKLGIGIAIFLRIGLLFVLVNLIQVANKIIFSLDFDYINGHFNLHSLIVLIGGVFILYTALKEIWHMIAPIDDLNKLEDNQSKSVGSVIAWIVVMNLVFSFDSILSAMALTQIFSIMALAIVIGGILMIWLANGVAEFLEKNKLFEVLGLFILFIVGIMLLTEGAELAHLHILNNPIEKMSKTTFYFVIIVLVLIDIVQSRYQKNILKRNKKGID